MTGEQQQAFKAMSDVTHLSMEVPVEIKRLRSLGGSRASMFLSMPFVGQQFQTVDGNKMKREMFTTHLLETLASSVPQRLSEVFDNNGGATYYGVHVQNFDFCFTMVPCSDSLYFHFIRHVGSSMDFISMHSSRERRPRRNLFQHFDGLKEEEQKRKKNNYSFIAPF